MHHPCHFAGLLRDPLTLQSLPKYIVWALWPIKLHFPSGLADPGLLWSLSLPANTGLTPHTPPSSLTGSFSLCRPTHQFAHCSWRSSLSCPYCFGPEVRTLCQNSSKKTAPWPHEQLIRGLSLSTAFSKTKNKKNHKKSVTTTPELYLIGWEGMAQNRVFDMK